LKKSIIPVATKVFPFFVQSDTFDLSTRVPVEMFQFSIEDKRLYKSAQATASAAAYLICSLVSTYLPQFDSTFVNPSEAASSISELLKTKEYDYLASRQAYLLQFCQYPKHSLHNIKMLKQLFLVILYFSLPSKWIFILFGNSKTLKAEIHVPFESLQYKVEELKVYRSS
jgi:hypothetical protein